MNKAITVKKNEKALSFSEGSTLADVLSEEVGSATPFAAALNHVFIPRSQYESTQLNDGDEITVVTPMQGG